MILRISGEVVKEDSHVMDFCNTGGVDVNVNDLTEMACSSMDLEHDIIVDVINMVSSIF